MRKQLVIGIVVATITLAGGGVLALNNQAEDNYQAPDIETVETNPTEQIDVKEDSLEPKVVEESKPMPKISNQTTSTTPSTTTETPKPQKPELREWEITEVKKTPSDLSGKAGNDPEWRHTAWGCQYKINTITRYKSSIEVVPLNQDCKKVGDLIQ